MSKLSPEERDYLTDLLFHEGYRALMKEMENYVQAREQEIISFQYKPGEEQQLYYLKTKALGAREFYQLMEKIVE